MGERACPGLVGRCTTVSESSIAPAGPGRTGRVPFPVGPGLTIALSDLSIPQAVRILAESIKTPQRPPRPTTVGFLNMRNHVAARASLALSEAFAKMDYVFADGVGLQIGRRLLGLPRFQRVSGTDMVPALLNDVAVTGCRVFLLGGTAQLSSVAAMRLPGLFPGITISGYQHGYFDASEEAQLLDRINASKSDLLLVGMGTPRQELWLLRNQASLEVRVVACVGGLFHYWAGDLRRSPRILIRAGFEWTGILLQQPHKWRIYTIDAIRFLFSLVFKREPSSSDEPFF